MIVKVFCFLIILFSNFAHCQCGNGICDSPESPESCYRDCILDSIKLVMKNGGRLDLLEGEKTLLVYDKLGKDGYYDVFLWDLESNSESCITCNAHQLPSRHNGQPAWHPDGEWIVFQSEKQIHKGNSRYSTPGRGVYCDLWVTNKQGTVFIQLTNLPNTGNYGVLHPHFSSDGKQLSWSELYHGASLQNKGSLFGHFKLKTADFNLENPKEPKLINTKEYLPADEVFYENHGFSPDQKHLLFSSNLFKNVSPVRGNKLCLLELETGKINVLADEGYNEHACFISNGNFILWGSSKDNKNKGMDYWIMKTDGTEKQRLTYFNKKGYPEYSRKRLFTVDMSWSEDKGLLAAYVQDNLIKDAGRIYFLYFKKLSNK